MNPWINKLLATIAGLFRQGPAIVPMSEETAAKFRAAVENLRAETTKHISVPSKLTSDSPGWAKLAKDLDIAPPTIDRDKLENAVASAHVDFMHVAGVFASSCSVNADGSASPPTEETDKKIVDLQTAAIAYATAFRECMKANVAVKGCGCLRCVLVRFAAIAYGNCPPDCDPAFVAVAFVNLMRVVKAFCPVVVIQKQNTNLQTPFSHN